MFSLFKREKSAAEINNPLPDHSAPKRYSLWSGQSSIEDRRAVLVFSRAGSDDPAATGTGANRAAADAWKKESPECVALEQLRSRLHTLEESLPDAKQLVADLKDQLGGGLMDDDDDTPQAIVDAETKLRNLEGKILAVRAAVPGAYAAARQSYDAWVADESAAQMGAAKPNLDAIREKIEDVINPLLDQFFEAKRRYQLAGKGFVDAATVLGAAPSADAKPAAAAQPTLRVGMFPPVGGAAR